MTQASEAPSRGLDAGIVGWQRVSRRLVGVELVEAVVGGLVGAAVAVGCLLLFGEAGWWVLGAVVLVTVVRLILVPRQVRAIGYVLRDDDLVVRRGILYSRLVAVPYGRMQLVDVNRGLVARALGLAELRLVTAAAGSNVTIPGLTEAEAGRLRDVLVDRAEQRRVGI